MGKKSKSGRSSKKNLAQNSSWLEERLESSMLDLDALSSMSIDEVQSELKAFKPDQKKLVDAINEKLPTGAAIPTPKTPKKRTSRKPQTRKAPDRQATKHQRPSRKRSSGIVSLRGALIFSLLVIASSIFIPRLIRDLREDRYEPATAIENEVTEDSTGQATWIEGPAAHELVRGVKYTVKGIEQVVINAPLPTNPGNLSATFELKMRIDANGSVEGLEALTAQPNEFEPTVMDSLLQWKFSATQSGSATQEAIITVEYFPVD